MFIVPSFPNFLAPQERYVYSTESSLRRSDMFIVPSCSGTPSLRRSDMFIALCLSRLFLTSSGAISLRLSHPQLAPLGAECVNPHGKYLLTNLHPNRFRSERSAFPHTTRLQRGAVQVHNRDCSQQRTETDLNQRNVGSPSYLARSETSLGFS